MMAPVGRSGNKVLQSITLVWFLVFFSVTLFAFSALTLWLVIRKSIQPVKIE